MNPPHLSISQAGVLALVSQLLAFVAGFGVINSVQEGVIISAATAAVNAAFLIANAVHAVAHAQSQTATPSSPPAA